MDVSGIERGGGLKEDDFDFFGGDGPVFDAAWDDEHFSGVECDALVAEFHGEAAAVDEEKLIFVFMMVPVESAFEFGEFYLLPVEIGGDAWGPVVGEAGEGFGEVEFHVKSY